jgi:iron complex transport system substrate-binding protein
MRRAALLLAVLALVVASVATACAEAMPQARRIVSANLCADRLVLALAPRAHVVSASALAFDPALSTVWREAQGLRPNRGDAEEILALSPDLVVLGAHAPRATAEALRRLGLRVHVVGLAEDLGAAKEEIRSLAHALGEGARGEEMVAALDARIAAIAAGATTRRAAVLLAGGWTAGSGTMADALLAAASVANIASRAGLRGHGALRLEALVAADPDLLVVEDAGDAGASLSAELLAHPVLARGRARVLRMPARLWACPDAALADAAALVAGAAR